MSDIASVMMFPLSTPYNVVSAAGVIQQPKVMAPWGDTIGTQMKTAITFTDSQSPNNGMYTKLSSNSAAMLIVPFYYINLYMVNGGDLLLVPTQTSAYTPAAPLSNQTQYFFRNGSLQVGATQVPAADAGVWVVLNIYN